MKKKIVILDDSPVILAMAKDTLECAGFEVVATGNLAEFEAAQRDARAPDLVLIDVNMPEAFGDDVAMVLRHVRDVRVPIYLFSSLDEEELARRAREAEIDGYLQKRSGLEGVVERVCAILERP